MWTALFWNSRTNGDAALPPGTFSNPCNIARRDIVSYALIPSMDVTSVGRDGHNPVHPTRGGRGARGPAHANVVRSWSTQASCSDPGKAGAQRTRDGVLGRHVHHGKTQVWNRSGAKPSGMEEIVRAAKVVKLDAVVWRGDPSLPTSQHRVKVLGIPIGHTEYVREFLERKTKQQEVLFHAFSL